MSVYFGRHKLELTVEGVDEPLPLVGAQATFALNQIPRASVSLGVGRDTETNKAAKIHDIWHNLKRFSKAKLVLESHGQYDEDNKWPGKPITIFDGMIDGTGGDNSAMQVQLAHWLLDLEFSTALSADSHPANPADMTFRAIRGTLIPGAGAAPPNSLITSDCQLDGLGLDKITASADIWANCFKPVLCAVAGKKHVKMSSQLNPCQFLLDGDNTRGLAALNRIAGPASNCNTPYPCYLPPLKLRGGTVSPAAGTLYKAAVKDTVHSYLSTTLWGKLTGHFAAYVHCAIVPQVDRALFAPVCPGLQQTYCKVLDIDDWDKQSLQLSTNKPLRGVGVTGKHYGTDGRDPEGKDQKRPSIMGLAGCYAPENPDKDGLLLFVGAPPWLENVASTDYSARKTSGIKDRKVPSTALTPHPPIDELAGSADGKSPAEQVSEATQLYRNYAKATYLRETLRGRTMNVRTKLRFDIAPGSNVIVRNTGDLFLLPNQQLVGELIGTVTKVTYTISADPATAETRFELAWLRTVDQNKSEMFSTDGHPLIDSLFTGAPLVDELSFGDCC
jgi:hypothetical protein